MKLRIVFIYLLFTATFLAVSAYAQSPQETLDQYIADLQKNPDDYALREKIIRHVQTMGPGPLISEDAKRFLARGKAAFKGAKELKDFIDAAEEFKKAVLYVPWLAEGYYNLGIVQDKAGFYDEAMQNLKLYLIAAPGAPDAEKVKELTYEIEYRKEKAVKDRQAAAQKAAEDSRAQEVAASRKQEEFLQKINGLRYVYYFWAKRSDTGADAEYVLTLDVGGDTIIQGQGLANGRDWFKTGVTFKIEGHKIRMFVNGRAFPDGDGMISDDGYTIKITGAVYKRLR